MRKSIRNEWNENSFMPNKSFLVHAFYFTQKTPGDIVPTHWHENMEFVLVTGGVMQARCNNVVHTVTAGEVVVINSNEYHTFSCIEAPLHLCCVVADMKVLNSRYFDACEEKYIQPLLHNQILFRNILEPNEQSDLYMRQITDEYLEKSFGYELAVKATLYNLLVIFLRNNTIKIMSLDESLTHNKNYTRINRVLKQIEMNYTDKLNIDDMAAMINVSRFYFCKLFKKMTGYTFSEYINNLRISEAVNLLVETDMSVTDIATSVGYFDINYFSHLFKSINGVSPTHVRKNGLHSHTL